MTATFGCGQTGNNMEVVYSKAGGVWKLRAWTCFPVARQSESWHRQHRPAGIAGINGEAWVVDTASPDRIFRYNYSGTLLGSLNLGTGNTARRA